MQSRSAQSIRVALGDASVEDRLNSVVVEQRLDDTVAELLSARDYQPILRTLRLLFGEGNRESLAAFLPKVPAPTWLRLGGFNRPSQHWVAE